MNKYDIQELEEEPIEAVKRVSKSAFAEYLTFGERAAELAPMMLEKGWKGISVVGELVPERQRFLLNARHKEIVAHVHQDPRLIQLLDGTWRRSLTIQDIFIQFPGPYQLIAAVHTGQDRRILEHECAVACDPRVIVIGEDGHNEDVIAAKQKRGYSCKIAGDMLIMVKP